MPTDTHAWHAPTDHEHGDAPPAWADAFSCAQFGHPVIFGGDESTPGEVAGHHDHGTHVAFKVFAWTAVADDGLPIDFTIRVHFHQTPPGRTTPRHSYEFYAGRDGDVLMFTQGWLDFGPAPDNRDSWADGMSAVQIVSQYDPANHMIGFTSGDNANYSIGYGREFWYAQQSTPDGWEPLVSLSVWDPVTYFAHGEHLDPMDMDAWEFTGWHGIDREVSIRVIAGGSTATNATGQPFLDRNMLDPRGWFCATPTGDITSTGSATCASGSLPQFISLDMPTFGDAQRPGSERSYRNQWVCEDCGEMN